MFVLAEAQPRLTRLVHGCQCPGNILKRIKAGIFVVMFKALGKFAKMCFVSLGWRLCGTCGVAEKCVAEGWQRGFPEELVRVCWWAVPGVLKAFKEVLSE